jgi:hypothetical protein
VSVWRAFVHGLDNAPAKLQELADLSPNERFAMHTPSKAIVGRVMYASPTYRSSDCKKEMAQPRFAKSARIEKPDYQVTKRAKARPAHDQPPTDQSGLTIPQLNSRAAHLFHGRASTY